MTITSQLLEAYVKCPTKCWLRYAGENATGNAYAAWVQAKNEACRVEGIKRLVADVPDAERVAASPTKNLKMATWQMAGRPSSASAKSRDSDRHRRACALGGPGQGRTVHPYPLRLGQ
jgi:hypothetical protein